VVEAVVATVAEATAVIEAIAAETATDTAAAATAQGKSLNISGVW